MKRLLATLTIAFIVFLHAAGIASAISYEEAKEAAIIRNNRETAEKFALIKNEAKALKPSNQHNATWYKTDGTRVHRKHPTAAYNFAPKGTKILVTSLVNKKTCIVEVTDRMEYKNPNHIDLSYSAFGYLASHSTGTIKVIVKIIKK